MFNVAETAKFLIKGVADSSNWETIIEKLEKVKNEGRCLNIKLGLDPTAPDVHIGHAVVLRKIRQMQNLGHRATIIIGDFTARIGDPSGRSKTRPPLSDKEVMENAETYKKQIFKIVLPDKTDLRFNSEWLSKLNFENVIRLCSTTTVARLLERDDFQNRFKNNFPIGLHEFFYPLMQAYDSVAIKADVEIGGTDQTFNILMGRNIQKDYGMDSQLVIFMPLLEGIDGVEKMSKSLGNYVGINEDAYSMFEKIMRIPDDKIIKYYELTTDEHPDKINQIKNDLENDKINPRDIKMQLAKDIIKLYHSESKAICAMEKFVAIYQNKTSAQDSKVILFETGKEINLIDVLFDTKDFNTKSEIRRLFLGSAIKINGEKQINFNLDTSSLKNENLLQVGKSKVYKLNKKI